MRSAEGTTASFPTSALVADAAGNLYGDGGGGAHGFGAIFKLTRTYWRVEGERDLQFPRRQERCCAYGRTTFGILWATSTEPQWLAEHRWCVTRRGCGTVFQLTPGDGGKWTESVLHSFTAGNDGQNPTDAVIVEAGKLYGTTLYGGAHNDGVVFEVKP